MKEEITEEIITRTISCIILLVHTKSPKGKIRNHNQLVVPFTRHEVHTYIHTHTFKSAHVDHLLKHCKELYYPFHVMLLLLCRQQTGTNAGDSLLHCLHNQALDLCIISHMDQ